MEPCSYILSISEHSINLNLFDSKAGQTLLSQINKLSLVSYLSARTHQPSSFQLWIFPQTFNIDNLTSPYTPEVVSHPPNAWTNVKYFLTSPIHSTVLPISRSIAFCFFLASCFIFLSLYLIKLFQKYISIIRRLVSAATSSTSYIFNYLTIMNRFNISCCK